MFHRKLYSYSVFIQVEKIRYSIENYIMKIYEPFEKMPILTWRASGVHGRKWPYDRDP